MSSSSPTGWREGWEKWVCVCREWQAVLLGLLSLGYIHRQGPVELPQAAEQREVCSSLKFHQTRWPCPSWHPLKGHVALVKGQ